MHIHLALVVHRAARVEIAVALRGFEGRRDPQIQRVGGLHIVVAIAEHGWLAGRMQPIGIDQRMTGGRDDLDILQTRAPQAFGDELSGALHIAFVLGQGADARNPDEFLQFIEQARAVLLNIGIDGGHAQPL